MGLAASQSRFLLLTARQNTIESKLVSLGNQQLALQRKSIIREQQYNEALNAQTVTYNDQPLSYSSIMQPATSGKQKMLTNSAGAVMLTTAKAADLGLGGYGSGSDFTKVWSSQDDFVNHFVPGYSSSSSSNSGNTSSSAYKYDDSVLNNVFVSASSATVAGIQGYEAGTTLEYSMGTQQDWTTAMACIYTLDKYQYTDSNVHAVTNSFVADSVEQMSLAMIDSLGSTDAINKAAEYAAMKTQEYYKNAGIDVSNSDIKKLAEDAEKNNGKLNTTQILVGTADYTVTTTTGITQGSDSQTSMTMTTYNGKEVYINTAQLSAVFLNYFDVAMMNAVGSDDAKARAEKLEKQILQNSDQVGLRNDLAKTGYSYTTGNEENPFAFEVDTWNKRIDAGEITGEKQTALSVPKGGNLVKGGVTTCSVNVGAGQSTYVDIYTDTKQNTKQGYFDLEYVGDVTDANGNTMSRYKITNKSTTSRQFSFLSLSTAGNQGSSIVGKYGDQELLNEDKMNSTAGVYGNTSNTLASTQTAAVEYYKSLYNAMATGGWSRNSSLTDPDYLNQQMLYGNIVLNEFSNNSSWKALSMSDSKSGLNIEENKEAVEKAKTEYEMDKNRIDYQSKLIENQTSTLQTELDAITNEQDSVKSIIENEMAKFSLFQNA